MKKIFVFAVLISLFFTTSCDSKRSAKPAAAPQQPVDIGLRNRAITRLDSGVNEVAVYLPGLAIKYIPGPVQAFQIPPTNDFNAQGILDLQKYILDNKKIFDLGENSNAELVATSIMRRGARVTIRLNQHVSREVKNQKYRIPLEGCSVIALFNNGRLESLSSTLENPPNMSFILEHPGIAIQFSGKEYDTFLRYIANSPNKDKIKGAFENLASNSGIAFDFDAVLAMRPAEQRQELATLFRSLKKVTTAKILIEMAIAGRLAYIKHHSKWFFQVTQLFDLPLQFDLAFPDRDTEQLRMRNLRELIQKITINVNTQPVYPQGKKELRIVSNGNQPQTHGNVTPTDMEAAQLYQNITRFYRQTHQWIGYDGSNDSTVVEVNKDIASFEWAENAFWSNTDKHFGIGAGGDSITNLYKSMSTLGHEYGHAIIQHTSGLLYQGQSGAINEHFCDVQGVTIEAYFGSHEFDYTIAEDILTPLITAPKKEEIDLKIKEMGISPEDVTKHSLGVVALRNLYEPSLSLLVQQSSMAEVAEAFRPDCEPSVDNDYCGVHSTSGVMNRATSLIISKLGIAKLRPVFFNTVVSRLGSKADFEEYLRQLYEECLITPALDKDKECPVIIESFEKVGVKYPTAPATS